MILLLVDELGMRVWVMQDAEGKELFHLQRGFAIPVQLCYPCAHLACNPLKVCSMYAAISAAA